MTGRQIYRRVLTGALILVLGAISVLGFREMKNSVPDRLYVFSGEENPLKELQQNPLIVWEEAVTAAGGDAYTVSCSFCGVIPLKTVKVQQISREQVKVSGENIGIYMETNGVLIIDSGQL